MQTDDIKILIQELLQKLMVSVDTLEVVDDPVSEKPRFLLQTKDSHLLIGNQGVNLQALNHILKQAIRQRFPNLDIQPHYLIDVNGYYGKRLNDILYQAKITAERVKMFKRDIELLPMNAYERLLVHNHFSNDGVIKTESQGEGKFRKVVLKYCEEKSVKSVGNIEVSF